MSRDILTISDALIEPPSEPMVIRTITMISHADYRMSILLHTTQDMKDLYYHWMKPRGLMDYVAYIISETEYEDGVRLDTTGIYPQTIVTQALRLEGQAYVLNQIKMLSGIE